MNDSSWDAPSRTGYGEPWPTSGQGAASAGPVYEGHDVQETRPMPIVPDVPANGGDQDDDRGPLG